MHQLAVLLVALLSVESSASDFGPHSAILEAVSVISEHFRSVGLLHLRAEMFVHRFQTRDSESLEHLQGCLEFHHICQKASLYVRDLNSEFPPGLRLVGLLRHLLLDKVDQEGAC